VTQWRPSDNTVASLDARRIVTLTFVASQKAAAPKNPRNNPKTVPAQSVAADLKAARAQQASKASQPSQPSKGGANKSGRPGGRPPGVTAPPKARLGDWIGAARIQTLPIGIAPVALGTAAAFLLAREEDGPGWHWLRALLCLIVAVSLQIGVNFANDYSDGVRGTDRLRVGPQRLTASGRAKPRTVLTVALMFFGFAAVAGIIIVIRTEYWWLLGVGAACILAAWFYTGGKRPYGYYGLGELFAFVFFGLVATAGTTFVLADTVTIESWLAGVAIGLIACAALMVNNIRDREQDARVGKRTLAVLIGELPSRIVFSVFILSPFGILVFFTAFYENAYLVFFALMIAVPAAIITLTARTPAELVLALRLTGLTALFYGLGLAFAIAL